jgi:general secretion pathway protein C
MGDIGEMKYYFSCINILFLTLCIYFLVQLFYTFALPQVNIPSLETRPLQKKTVNFWSVQHIKPITNYKYIAQRDLFGIQRNNSKTPIKDNLPKIENIDPTDLDVRLWGTVTGNKSKSYAIIESKTPGSRYGKQQLLQIGDKVLTASIETIYRNKIILNVEGEQQVLTLEKYQDRQSRRSKTRRSSTKKPRKYNRTIKQKEIENAFENITSIMKQAQISPHAKGMRISRIRRNSLFQKLGLRNGDVITGVNGRKIGSVDDALSLYRGLQSGSRVSIDLERRRRPVTITYTVN